MSANPSAIDAKLALLIRMLASQHDGEVIAAARGTVRVLNSAGQDIHALAARIEKPSGNGLTDAEMKKVYDAGYSAGVQATEQRHQGIDDFSSTDGKPTWEAVALFLQRNKHRLDAQHHTFIDDMASRTAWGREPTEKQHKYLRSLFFKLGGKIT